MWQKNIMLGNKWNSSKEYHIHSISCSLTKKKKKKKKKNGRFSNHLAFHFHILLLWNTRCTVANSGWVTWAKFSALQTKIIQLGIPVRPFTVYEHWIQLLEAAIKGQGGQGHYLVHLLSFHFPPRTFTLNSGVIFQYTRYILISIQRNLHFYICRISRPEFG